MRNLLRLVSWLIVVALAVATVFPQEAVEYLSSTLPTFVPIPPQFLTNPSGFSASPTTRPYAIMIPVLLAAGLAVLVFRKPRRGNQNAGVGAVDQPRAAASRTDLPKPGTELRAALTTCRGAFTGAFVFSALSNLLMLTGSIFMLEVYDRVLPSRSVPTLVALAALATMFYAAQGLIDAIRGRLLSRIGSVVEASVGERVFNATLRLPSRPDQRFDGQQPIRDLEAIRSFLGGGGPTAFMDLPWLPFYLAIIFVFHPLLGSIASIGAVILVSLTYLTEYRTRDAVSAATFESSRRTALVESGRRNADVVKAMGMGHRLGDRYGTLTQSLIAKHNAVSDVAGSLGVTSRTLRMMLQSAMLGLGAWLVIHGEASAGVIIASSILVGRALAPVDQSIAQWKNFVAARQGWARLKVLLVGIPPEPPRLALPGPRTMLKVDNLSVSEPGGQRILVRDATFELQARSGLAIIGASGSGKSTLARAMVGAWPAASGHVKLDGAAIDQWPSELVGLHIGYLPQDVELFAGTVTANIARLDPEPDADAVISAARAAGCHNLIISLRDGYQTQIGEGGAVLSAGQRQRIGLARALYGDPFLVVLDEPNANLDTEGDRALMTAIAGVRNRGGIAVVISHRPHALEAVDFVLIMHEGRPLAFGPRENVLAKFYPGLAKGELPPTLSENDKPTLPSKEGAPRRIVKLVKKGAAHQPAR